MPSTTGGAGSMSSSSAWATKASWVTGQLIGSLAATAATDCPEPIARAACRRSRPVTRAPGGTSLIDSVNALRGQAASRHRYCALCQRTTSGCSP